MKKIIPLLALCAIAASAAEPTKPKPLSAQERVAQRRAQNTNAPATAIKLGPQFQVQVFPGVMVTIKSTNTFTSAEAARILRQAIIKIQTGR